MKTDSHIRAVQLDLARQMEPLGFIKNFIDFIAEYHYNTLFLYLEWRIRTEAVDLGPDEGYSPEELGEIVEHARKRGVEVIPGLAALGHAELLLSQEKYANLSELRGGLSGRFGIFERRDLCPSLPDVRNLVERYITEAGRIFPSPYIHVGGDEVWNFGFCELCRPLVPTLEAEGLLFLDYFKFCRRIVTERLHKRMMMWDDMFEYYPQILPELPKDIILVNWQYQANVCGWKGHFANSVFFNQFQHYAELELDYLIAPAEFHYSNVESFTNASAGYRHLGGLLTSWEKKNALMYKYYPLIAAAGFLWSGKTSGGDEAFFRANSEFFGISNQEFLTALHQYCQGIGNAAALRMKDLCSHPFDGPNRFKAAANLLARQVLSGYLTQCRDNRSKAVLEDIVEDLEMKILADRSRLFAWRKLKKQESEPLDVILRDLDLIARKRIVRAGENRREADLRHFSDNFRLWREALIDFTGRVEKNGIVTVLYCLPDAYGSERIKLSIRPAEKGFTEIACGVFKVYDLSALFEYTYFCDRKMVPETVLFECRGFAGQGIAYVTVVTEHGTFVPSAVNASGRVANVEAVLENNVTYAMMGSSDTMAAFHDRGEASRTDSLSVTLRNIPETI